MPSSVCLGLPLMTYSPALEANSQRATFHLAVTAAIVPRHKLVGAQWRFFHGIPHYAAA
jgi:hypothetical protein